MNTFPEINTYPIKVIQVVCNALIGVTQLRLNTKVDYGFANVLTTDNGPCTMFRVPISTKIVAQNDAIVFQLDTRNNFDIYYFDKVSKLQVLINIVNQSYVEHTQLCKKEIANTLFANIHIPILDIAKLEADLLTLIKKM